MSPTDDSKGLRSQSLGRYTTHGADPHAEGSTTEPNVEAASTPPGEPVEGPPRDSAQTQTFVPTDPSPRSEPPRRSVGPYVLVEKVGEGAQGVVWRAVQTEPFRRMVALKVFDLGLALDDRVAEQYRREAERSSRVNDAAILPIYNFGREDGHVYLAMQFVEGCTLRQFIAQRRAWLDGESSGELHGDVVKPPGAYVQTVADLIERVARALHQAHLEGLVHRDVKPSNILLDNGRPGRVYLSDFGLARERNETPGGSGWEPGTRIYMAPEVLRREGNYDGPRCDVFSLGATLYEALVLKPARHLDSLRRAHGPSLSEIDAALAEQRPTPCRKVDPRLPRDLEAIVARAMAMSPADRYPSAEALADDLRRFRLADPRDPVHALPRGPLDRLLLRLRPHQGKIAVVALLLLAVLVLAAALAARDWRTARRVAQLHKQAEQALNAGELEQALPLVDQARELAPRDPRTIILVRRATRRVFDREYRNLDSSGVDRAISWYRRWLETEPGEGERLAFTSTIGLQSLPIVSEPPGAWVVFHPIHPDGRPRGGPPLYRIVAGSQQEPATLNEVVVGSYWVTAYQPQTGAFVEGPRLVSLVEAPQIRPPLVFRPRTDAEVQAALTLRWVSGGRLRMGRNGPSPTRVDYPEHPVAVGDVYLGATEVTNRQVDAYLTEANREVWRSWVWGKAGRPEEARLDWPAVNVPPQLAQEIAAWHGCRLPSEEELEWAARGVEGRLEPPAPAPPADDPRWLALHEVSRLPEDRVDTPSGPIFDLFANAAEITQFLYRPYPGSRPTHLRDPWFGLVLRCGLVSSPSRGTVSLGYTGRASQPVLQVNSHVGFRLARTPRRPSLFPHLEVPEVQN